MTDNIIEINGNEFKEKVIEKSREIPVIVDFWAGWCMPCMMLAPVLEKIAKENNGKLILAKVDVDKNPNLSQEYHIMGIPAVKIFKDGKIVEEFTGVLPEQKIKEYLDRIK